MFEEDLQANAVEAGQIEIETLARYGFNCCVKPELLIIVLYDLRSPEAERTPTSTAPTLKAETGFVKGEDP